jgi:hypothetical protein
MNSRDNVDDLGIEGRIILNRSKISRRRGCGLG